VTAQPKLEPILSYLQELDAPADLAMLRRLLTIAKLRRDDLQPFVLFLDDHYARNLICKSAWFELVCVCWKSGQATPIHDHKGSSCAFVVVEGCAIECLYGHAVDGLLGDEKGAHRRSTGYVCASSEADIHLVRNDQRDDLITLHIYSPALTQMNTYDPATRLAAPWSPTVVDAQV